MDLSKYMDLRKQLNPPVVHQWSPTTLDLLGVGYTDDVQRDCASMPYWTWAYSGPAMFLPARNIFGNIFGLQFRADTGEYYQYLFKKKRSMVWGYDSAFEKMCDLKCVCFVEGLRDFISVYSAGLPVVAFMSISFNRTAIETKIFPVVKSVICGFDKDAAGVEGSTKLAKFCSQFDKKMFQLPFDGKDPHSFYESNKLSALGLWRNSLEEAATYSGLV